MTSKHEKEEDPTHNKRVLKWETRLSGLNESDEHTHVQGNPQEQVWYWPPSTTLPLTSSAPDSGLRTMASINQHQNSVSVTRHVVTGKLSHNSG